MESIVNSLHIQVSFEINTLIIVFFVFVFFLWYKIKVFECAKRKKKKAIQGKQLWNWTEN